MGVHTRAKKRVITVDMYEIIVYFEKSKHSFDYVHKVKFVC